MSARNLRDLPSADWDRLEQIVARFEQAWRDGLRPALNDFLAVEPPLRQTVLVELIHADMEFRCLAGEPFQAATYLQEYPALSADRTAVLALLRREFELRRERDPRLTPAAFAAQYPSVGGDWIAQLAGGNGAFASPSPNQGSDTTGLPTTIDRPKRAPMPAVPEGESLRQCGYELMGVLGRGGMGVVYQARQTQLKRLVALKMILAGGHADDQELGRFRTEAESAARLQHPNIVQIYEVGEVDGRPYLALEYVDGGSLAQKLAGTPLPPGEAAHLAELLARGVHAAHERGVVHRDLKPANVLLSSTGLPKITDFGLAKQMDNDSAHTRTGAVMGTPSYMAPEQASGKVHDIGPPADIYSLGAILYEMLTGRPPFRGATVLDTLEQVRAQEPVAVRVLQPSVPRDLETICMKCLEKDSGKRFASAAALADDLHRHLAGEPIRARPVGRTERVWKWVKRNKVITAAGATVVATLIAGTVISMIFAVKANRAAVRAADNEVLANSKAGEAANERDAARKAAAESRYRTVRLAVGNGSRFRDINDLNQTLLWYSRAWQLDDSENAAAEEAHRLRVGGVLAQMPELAGAFFHTEPVLDAQFAPDGGSVLTHTGGSDGYVWEAEGSQLRFPPLRHVGPIRHACYSPDGRLIAVADASRDLVVWNAADGSPAFRLPHPAPLLYVAVNVAGSLVATCSEDGNVRLWDVKTKQLTHTLPLSAADPPAFAAFDPAGRRLVTANRTRGARLWDPATGKPVGPDLPHQGRLAGEKYRDGWGRHPVFRPDGLDLITATFQSFHICATGDGKELSRRTAIGTNQIIWVSALQPSQVSAIRMDRIIYSPDGKLFALLSGSDLRLFDRITLKETVTIKQPREAIVGAYSPNGRFVATASTGGLVHLWDAGTGAAVPGWPLPRCASEVTALSFSPEPDSPRLLVASRDGTARVWAIEPPRPDPYRYDCGSAHHWKTAQSRTSADGRALLSYSPAEKLLSLRDPRVENAAPRWVYDCTDGLSTGDLSADGRRAVLCTQAGIRSLDATTGRPLPGPDPAVFPKGVRLVVLDHTGRRAALRDDATSFAVWDLDTGTPLLGPIDMSKSGPRQFVLGEDGQLNQIAISLDGRKVAASVISTGEVALWDVEERRRIPLGHQAAGINVAVFSDDGKTLLIHSSDTTARAWDTTTRLPVSPTLRHSTPVGSAGISPDGRRIATVSSDVLRVWDGASGDLLSQWSLGELYGIRVPRSSARVCWFSADGQRIVAGTPGDSMRPTQLWTFPLPRYDGGLDDLSRIGRLLTGQQLDESEGLEFLDQATFRTAPDAYRQAFLSWKTSKKDVPPKTRTVDPPEVVETNPHRRAARWVLSLGGKTQVLIGNARPELKTVQDMPAQDFQLALVDLRNNRQVQDDGLARLTPAATIQYVDLAYTRVTNVGLAHLSGLTNLTVLRLGKMRISDPGMVHLQGLTRIRQLTLYNTGVGDAGLEHLKNLTELTYLDLGGTKVTDAGLATVARFNKLEHLELNGLTQVSDAGLAHLKRLTNLSELHVTSTSVGDAGLEHLKDLSKLTLLVLSRTQVTDVGLEHLKTLDRLKELDLCDTRVTAAGAAELQKALPKCQIRFGPSPK